MIKYEQGKVKNSNSFNFGDYEYYINPTAMVPFPCQHIRIRGKADRDSDKTVIEERKILFSKTIVVSFGAGIGKIIIRYYLMI